MSKNIAMCERVDELLEQTDSFEELSSAEQRLATTHWQSCQRCRFVHEVCLAEFGDDSPLQTDGPLPPLDELSRHRAIDQIIEQSNSTPQKQPSYRWPSLAIAVAAAIVLGAVFIYLQIEKPAATTGTQVRGTIVLLSGRASTAQNSESALLSAGFTTNNVLSTRRGNMAIQLPTEILLLMGAESTLHGKTITDTALDVQLSKGSLYINATPGRKGPPFRIFTPHGTVTVTGTALAVRATSETTTVEVYRGKVAVRYGDNELTMKLHANQSMTIGSGSLPQPTVQDFSENIHIITRMQYLAEHSGNPASLHVNSSPPNAQVFIDDVYLGDTPVDVSIAPGHSQLRIAYATYVPIREAIDVKAGNTLERNFLLVREADSSSLDAAATEAPTAVNAPRESLEVVLPKPSGNAPLANALLTDARAAMSRKDWQTASTLYREITTRFPRSVHAANAHISAGRIALEHLGDPRGALSHFNAYIKRTNNSSLLPEALLGKAKALRVLGRHEEERSTLETFISRFPDSIHRKVAAKRMEQLKKNSDW